ncbi:MAG: helix-turn-helix transcriptional regulator [Clostridia bacterium]|nr:helix-turn-helix transcriptional regulator [Clostridia bacterium]
MICYDPLWETMQKKNITTYTLIYKLGFSPQTIHNLKHNKSITIYTLEKLCKVLNCTPNDVLKFTDAESIE